MQIKVPIPSDKNGLYDYLAQGVADLVKEAEESSQAIAQQYVTLPIHTKPGMLPGIACLANTAALLALCLEDVNWVGFYLLHEWADDLILGPFVGRPAVSSIPLGSGVCGTAAIEGMTQRVDDVHACDNHIVCDPDSASEIVVPIVCRDCYGICKVCGVLDIDSPVKGRFDEDDQRGLERIAELITTVAGTLSNA